MINPDIDKLYAKRFPTVEREAKAKLWKCLIDSYLSKFFDEDMTIIDLGCGFCEFINTIKGKEKYAFDIEASFESFTAPDVEFIKAEEGYPIPIADNSCDRVFASNFFEHLKSREEIKFILKEAYRILKPSGKIIIIQPNIALLDGAFWDFFDHNVPVTEKSTMEALELVGFVKSFVKRRFLPYTTKRKLSYSTFLLKIYLKTPLLQLIFGKQSLIIAEKR